MYWRLSLLLILFFTGGLAAQEKNIFDHYWLNEGFTSREAMQVCATSNGMIWISSNDGLVRYDSKRFKFYTHQHGDTTSLMQNYCTAIAVDQLDRLWIKTGNNLDVFNTATETFTHIKLKDRQGAVLNVAPTNFLYQPAGGIMWVGTETGLFYCKNGSTTLQTVKTICSNEKLTTHSTGQIVAENDTVIWVTSGRDIIKLNIQNGHTENFQLPQVVDGFKNPPNASFFMSAWLDNNKILWLGTRINGLVSFNTVTQTFHQYCFRDNQKEENTIFAIAQTGLPGQQNLLWLSTASLGLQTFNTETKTFAAYQSPYENDKNNIKKGNTYGLFVQPRKALWIGSESGLHRYDFNKQLFKTIDLSAILKNRDPLPVESIAVERSAGRTDRKVWIHVPYIDGYVYDLEQKKFSGIPAPAAKYFKPGINFWGQYIDGSNTAWIATGQYGLIGYDIAAQRIIVGEKQFFYKDWQWVNGFFEDHRGNTWLQTFNGLFMIDGNKKITEIKEVNSLLENEKMPKAIVGVTEDENGTIWFVADYTESANACIGSFNPATKKAALVYREKDDWPAGTPTAEMGDIVTGKNGSLFVSIAGNGILHIENAATQPRLSYLTGKDGLNGNYVAGMIKDSAQNIWCSTSFGLSGYKQTPHTFTNYASAAYNIGSSGRPVITLSRQSGNLYIGQSKTVDYINVYEKKPDSGSAALLFTGFKVYNKEWKKNGAVIKDGDAVTLGYSQSNISIEFALLSYTNPFDNRYSWMLQGVDKEWNTTNNNIAAYSNLKPGRYVLLVKAADCYGNSNGAPIKLYITITPPFYNTWWFYVLCVLAVASLTYWLAQLKMKRTREKYQLRNKIASDLHDEIGSTLTSISILSNVSQQALERAPEQAKGMLRQIAAQSKTIQQNMSDIVWSIRSENEKTENLLIRMREYAAQTLEPLNIAVTIDADAGVTAKTLPMQYRKDLLLIYKEAINNITKHANASTVKVSLSNGKQKITLLIEDNGSWKGSSSGTGTKTMQERIAAMGGQMVISGTATGTQLIFTIPVT
jgi:signal transduction histidine kinase/ligand-binding sensor domain-containing protein